MSGKLTYLISFVLVLTGALIGAAQEVDSSLVGWWTFDEDLGDVARDDSGNGNDATLIGGPVWSTATGHRGIIELDGTDDHVYIDGTSYELPLYTIAMWFRVDGGSGDRDILSAKGPTGVNGVMLEIEPDGTLRNLHRFPFTSSGGSNIYTTETYDDGAWHHAATVKTASEMILYVDGQEVGTQPDSNQFEGPLGEIWLGTLDQRAIRMFPGGFDDLRLYNRVLSEQEIAMIMEGEPNPYAYGPEPRNGARHEDTWSNLKWEPGDLAVSHDLYFGTDFDAVNDGSEGTFIGNTISTFQMVGFPGYPAPEGLQLGTTYYWRVDEVSPAEPDSPWKGKVWSFIVPPKEAYNPLPPDGAMFQTTDITLSWTLGVGTKLHTVYFGGNFNEVSNAAGGLTQAPATYDPGALSPGTTYYWRIDEFDGIATHKGNIWSFSTSALGGGLKGEYFNNQSLTGDPVLTRIDPGIDFSWGLGSPDPNIVNADSFSVRWRGDVEIAFTEAYRFYAVTEDGVKMWVNDQLAIDRWNVYRLNEYRSDPVELQAGQKITIEMWTRENDTTGETASATAQLLWESAHQPKGVIPAEAFSPPLRAGSPRPANGAVDTRQTLVLKWVAGDYATQQDVYFGTDANAVAGADAATAGVYQGRQTETGFSPPKLDWGVTYYWRVDEINDVHPDSPWVGNLWSFTTGNFLVVDDFEDYDAGENQIWFAWHDGLGYGVPGTADYFAGNGTASAVGDETTLSYTEEAVVHGGNQSMPLSYNNNKQGFAKYSEVELTLSYPRDWNEEGVSELSLWFRGYPASVGSFTETSVGTYIMTASGTDIWSTADKFHFAYKILTGPGTIVARVDSLENTNGWAKAGVMIRETLDAGSKHAFACVSPDNGVVSQGRTTTDGTSYRTNETGITAPYWVKLERDAAGNFTVSHSANGTTWQTVANAVPVNIPMNANVYVGLALTSHDAAMTCEAVFSNIAISGTTGPQWTNQDVGIESNAVEPLYVAVSNSADMPAVVVHDDPAAATMNTWTEWVIPLQAFAEQGVNLSNVNRIAVGIGTKGNMTIPGGSGTMYFDDIRLYRQRNAP